MAVKSSNRRPRVLSGIQPSGTLHLGNYLGALRPWAARQEAKENYFCIADMHAINEVQNPETLRRLTREAAAVYLAAGLDPYKSTIFVQSHVRAHAECCWILNCVTPLGWLERMTQFKSKSEDRESVSVGLLDYPVLRRRISCSTMPMKCRPGRIKNNTLSWRGTLPSGLIVSTATRLLFQTL